MPMKALKEIYVNMDLPNYVKKGKPLTTKKENVWIFFTWILIYLILENSVTLEAEVYNYLHKSTRIYVSLEKEKDEFEFVTKKGSSKLTFLTDLILPGKSKIINFQIRAKVRGMITLKISASCPFASYVNTKKLRVT